MARARRRGKQTAQGGNWLMTYADMATLLLTFFVLMLSISVVDVQRYKEIASSMRNALGGVQKAPAGAENKPVPTSHFGPGMLDGRPGLLEKNSRPTEPAPTQSQKPNVAQLRAKQIHKRENELKSALARDIDNHKIELSATDNAVIIRIQEKASFPSGSAVLEGSFDPVIREIARALNSTPDQIVVTGYTDDVPISSPRFRSNWDLSAARAVTVLLSLVKAGVAPKRLAARGMGENDPIVPNDSPAHRAMNRRVEIAVVPPLAARDLKQSTIH